MRRILVGLTAGVLGVVGMVGTAGTADARESHGHGGHHHANYRGQGHRFRGGYYYLRHDHPRWERRAWDAAHHRYHYWNPYLRAWYYWYPAGGYWYPDTYCP
jgi:hypothetical protein